MIPCIIQVSESGIINEVDNTRDTSQKAYDMSVIDGRQSRQPPLYANVHHLRSLDRSRYLFTNDSNELPKGLVFSIKKKYLTWLSMWNPCQCVGIYGNNMNC